MSPAISGTPALRLVQKVSSSRAFMKLAPHFLPAVDLAVHRLTRGKVQLSAQALPGLVLTARGAKSGLPRRTPLACMPEASGDWIVIGSNYGRPDHPLWTVNLLAHPDAEINWRGRDIPVTARLLEGEERARVWEEALGFWPPYGLYQARVEREIRVFRLTPR
ncbi:nitroreductase/quinone reductase family protein [Streptomyces himalayensis]|uniref:Nitroreductase family deazaflavin-dependent oxidoreductase n=1 Tax=Streptomyces himalayensis subsp. himalayensis TaxID=2756131 RepID=A0A7W0DL47_9ACTN|nr:nitroreductase/quinone reductase family protein [Streptomyces himalayensis]MBA2947127.1 nitroreductase family deazaflavin-dependent oxidoreductase [Streptomyces himalayensis subsp. himalayensis]